MSTKFQCIVFPLLASLFLFCGAGRSQTVQLIPTPQPTADAAKLAPGTVEEKVFKLKIERWQSALSRIAETERAPLFFDVGLDDTVPAINYTEAGGVRAMKALASATRRTWKEMDAVQTFNRTKELGQADDAEDVVAITSWIQSLSPQKRAALANGTLSLEQVEPQNRDLVQRLAGWEPDLGFVLLEKGNQVGLGLGLDLVVEYIDPTTGKSATRSIGCETVKVQVPKNASAPKREPLHKSESGPLDFGKGALLPLRAIVSKAESVFGTRYALDDRIANNWYFISGKLRRDAFDLALRQITTILPVRPLAPHSSNEAAARGLLNDTELAKQKADITYLRDQLSATDAESQSALKDKFGAKEELSAADFLQGKQMSVAQLGADKPGLGGFLSRLGLSPDVLVTLKAIPELVIQADGKHVMSNAFAFGDGQSVPVFMDNSIKVGLQ